MPKHTRPVFRSAFRTGLATLLEDHRDWLGRRRIGLVSHPAAVATDGASSAEILLGTRGLRLTAFFGPEHGFFGGANAGESVGLSRYSRTLIPVYSLYGACRRPTQAMLRNVDVLLVDFQNVAARCYTYVSTLRLILEAAAEYGKAVIVADRPVPLPNVSDGPRVSHGFESFVAAINVPMAYGLTPGEAAMWIRNDLGLDVDLKVARMRGYARESRRQPGWPPWIPPSPGIVSWESAECYTATVFSEAFPALDHGRGTGLPFQVLGAPWMPGRAMCERLAEHRLPGFAFHPHPFMADSPVLGRKLVDGLRISVTDPDRARPVTAGVCIMSALQELCGPKRLWRGPGARPDWIDKLYGTDSVRLAIQDGEPPVDIARQWGRAIRQYAGPRKSALLYRPS